MRYVKLLTTIYDDPKMLRLSDRAFRYYVESLAWAGRHETDGNVILAGKKPRHVQELIDVGLFDATDEAFVFHIHNYEKHQKTKAQLDQARTRAQAAADARWNPKPDAKSDAERNPDLHIYLDTDLDLDQELPTASPEHKPNPGQVPDRWPYFLGKLVAEDRRWLKVSIGALQRIAKETSRDAVTSALSFAAESTPNIESTPYGWLRSTAHSIHEGRVSA